MKKHFYVTAWVAVVASSPTLAFVTTLHHHGQSTTALAAGPFFKPSAKQQAKVAIDPKTGLYRPIKQTDNTQSSSSSDDGLSQWEAAKEALYKGVDGLAALPTKLPQPENTSSGVVGGYADIERELGGDLPKKVPLVKRPSTSTPVNKVLQSKAKQTNEPLLPPTSLEKTKNLFWGSVDAVQPKESKPASASTYGATMESFQPAVRARMVASDEFLQALQDLDSPNPVIRLAAGRKIQFLAKQEQAKMNPNPLLKVKQRFYQVADTLAATRDALVDLPRVAQQSYEKTVENTNQAVQAVQKVPQQLSETAMAVQQSINETVDNTQKTVKNVAELPSRVKTSIEQTNADIQQKVKSTKETAEKVSQTVQDLTTQSKVLLGLEKPKPRPPNTPPPEPMTPEQAALKILQISGSLAAQGAWFVGKNGAKLAWKVGSVAATKGGEVLSTKIKEYQEEQKKEEAKPKAVMKPVSPIKPSTQAAASADMVDFAAKEAQQTEEMSALEMEIEEALRMADAAIQSAQDEIEQEKKKSDDDKTNDDKEKE